MTKLYVWYSNSTSTTGRALARQLGLTNNGNKAERGYGTQIPSANTTHVISWGANKPVNRVEFRRRNLQRRKVLNNPYNIDVFKDKLIALQEMKSKGVSVPMYADRYGYRWRLPINTDEMSYPLIGRTKRHQGGSGFKFIENEEQLRNDNRSDYWLEYIDAPDKREYRVHVFRGEVIKVQRKKPMEDENGNKIEPRDYRCRSHNNGWRFSNCDISRIHDSVLSNARDSIHALGYDFGAVDIIRCPSINRTVVLEVNSGMGLDNAGLELYVSKINEWINN